MPYRTNRKTFSDEECSEEVPTWLFTMERLCAPTFSTRRLWVENPTNNRCLLYPEVLQSVLIILGCAEMKLVVTSLTAAITIRDFFVGDLGAARSPDVRWYVVARNLISSNIDPHATSSHHLNQAQALAGILYLKSEVLLNLWAISAKHFHSSLAGTLPGEPVGSGDIETLRNECPHHHLMITLSHTV